MSETAVRADTRSPWRDGSALLFALLFPPLMAWVYFVLLAGGGGRADPKFMAGYFGAKTVQFAFPALYAFRFARDRLRPGRPKVAGVGLGVAFALVASSLMLALYFGRLAGTPALEKAASGIHEKLSGFALDSPAGFVAAAVLLSLAHSLLEEYYWRWFVFDGLKRHLPMGVAAIGSGLGFMAHHVVVLAVYFPERFWSMALPCSLGIAFGGAAWAWIYHRSGSLLGPWLSHALIDGAIMVIGFDMLRAGWAG